LAQETTVKPRRGKNGNKKPSNLLLQKTANTNLFEKYLITTPKEVEREEAPRGDGLTRISSPNRMTRNLEIKKRSFFLKNHKIIFQAKLGQ
jgi:hypothetical protein